MKMDISKKYEQIINAMTYVCIESEENSLTTDVNKMNEAILKDFYKAVDYVLSKRFEEIIEIESNTINPAQQNIFMPLRVYRVLRNGHYKTIKIFQRFLGGFYIEETAI